MRGQFCSQYVASPIIDRPLEEIYRLLDNFTFEDLDGPFQTYARVVLPPLHWEGVFRKGIYYSPAVDVIQRDLPRTADIFYSIANSMCASIPWSEEADAYFTCYENPTRQRVHRQRHPRRAGKIWIPSQDGDNLDEAVFVPSPAVKDIDVLCVARLIDVKNLDFLAHTLRAHRRKYPGRRLRATLLIGQQRAREQLALSARAILDEVLRIVDDCPDLLEIHGPIDYWTMPRWYSRAKTFILTSLIEGKNRALLEAMSCDTPVITARELNRYARGDSLPFPEGAGRMAPFDPESMADVIEEVISQPGEFRPREAFLRVHGRRNFLNLCLDRLAPYQALPGFEPGNGYSNPWLRGAMVANYGLTLDDFLYGRGHTATKVARSAGLTGLGLASGADFGRLVSAFASAVRA